MKNQLRVSSKSNPTRIAEGMSFRVAIYFQSIPIVGSCYTAVDSLFLLEHTFTEKIRFKIREDIQTTPIEAPTSFSNVPDEEELFFTQGDNNKGTKNRPNKKHNHGKMQKNRY